MKRIPIFLAFITLASVSYEFTGKHQTVIHADEEPSWTKTEIPLTVHHADNLGLASAQGYWQSTSDDKDRQLVSPIAVKILCIKYDKICRESQASVFLGVLEAELLEYDIASWTADGIVADNTDDGDCGIGHRLSLDFKSNSVTVTDYPKKLSTGKNCKPFQDASSYSLHGGQLMLYPPAPWNPLSKPNGNR